MFGMIFCIVNKAYGSTVHTSFSSIDIPSPSEDLTGGTLTSVVGSWSSRVMSKEQDPSGMGHWSSITLVGK